MDNVKYNCSVATRFPKKKNKKKNEINNIGGKINICRFLKENERNKRIE